MDFDTPIRYLPGIGKKRAELFFNLGIESVGDLLYHFPRAYQYRGKILDLAMTPDGTVGAFMLTVATSPQTFMLKNRKQLTKLVAFDETGKVTLVFFNQPFIKDIFHVGEEYRVWGKVVVNGTHREISSPVYERVTEGKKLPDLIPVYPLTEGLTQKIIGGCIENVLDELKKREKSQFECLPNDVLKEKNLPDILTALEGIHRPTELEETQNAKRRFIYEELYLFALGILMNKKNIKNGNADVMRLESFDEFESALPYKLTNAQKKAIVEIYSDLSNEKGLPMNRLLSGDVGSGKTVCAAFAAYIAIKNGKQCALMAPTEILATQHYNDLSELFLKFGMKVGLLTGSLKASEKKQIKDGLAEGKIDLVIGTHAVLTDDVSFERLGLVITDEQHRFGVRQRRALSDKIKQKEKQPHVLVMSATPIPRTLALILYGDLELSVLDELPPGRQKVDTFLVDESYRDRLNGFIGKLAKENQVYIVCPSVEKTDDEKNGLLSFDDLDSGYTESENGLKSAVDYSEKLQNEVFPDLKIGLIHGKMKGNEKNKIMRAFEKNEIDVLVSTTVIEVGVNVPNAVLMVVENAERFGLSQLHQLRGRVGRGKAKSYCVLVSSSKSEKAKERLKTMCKTNDGYKIAEADLEQRGPGDFFPDSSGDARQHGSLRFRFASLCNMELLKGAFEDAGKTLECDPFLKEEKNAFTKRCVEYNFGRLSGT